MHKNYNYSNNTKNLQQKYVSLARQYEMKFCILGQTKQDKNHHIVSKYTAITEAETKEQQK